MSQTHESVPSLLRSVRTDVRRVVHAELALAKAKAGTASGRLGSGAIALGAALVLVFSATVSLVLSIGSAFGHLMPDWAAYLATTGVFLALALVAAAVGATQLRGLKTPRSADPDLGTPSSRERDGSISG